ncbi:MAG TPA: LysM peptidoglycan-binding domain-containing protein [Geopsychrobacteraceae bacterium]|jgi:membrane-bound lytic murein transglycosylase D
MLRFFPVLLLLILVSGCLSRTVPPPVGRTQALSEPTEQPAATVAAPRAQTAELPAAVVAADPVAPPLAEAVVSAATAPLADLVESFLAPAPAALPHAGDLPLAEHRRIDKYLSYYTGNGRRSFGRWLERAGRHIPRIQLVFANEGVPLDLAYLAMIESGFNERAYSWAHAAGPWQFIESTGRIYDLRNDWWRDERRDIEKSTLAAARFLKDLNRRFDGDWYLAAAAYNAGGGRINQAIRQSGSSDYWVLTEGNVLQEETKNYLPKLLAALTIVRDLKGHGFDTLDFQSPLAYETVILPTSTDLEVVARLGGVDYDELKLLNPELKRWCTPPGVADYRLRVPVGSSLRIEQGYALLPADQRARYHRHQVAKGDTLRDLARRYRIQVDDIVALNNIRDARTLQIGADLILPLREGFTRLPIDEMSDDYVRSRRQTYTVRKGDSLWEIARRFGVKEKELRVWNRLGWSNLLRPGQVLAVSGKGQNTVAAQATRAPRKMVYQVRQGDTLWGIGRQFDVKTEQIRTWNDLDHNHMLQPGQKLTLLVSQTQRS